MTNLIRAVISQYELTGTVSPFEFRRLRDLDNKLALDPPSPAGRTKPVAPRTELMSDRLKAVAVLHMSGFSYVQVDKLLHLNPDTVKPHRDKNMEYMRQCQLELMDTALTKFHKDRLHTLVKLHTMTRVALEVLDCAMRNTSYNSLPVNNNQRIAAKATVDLYNSMATALGYGLEDEPKDELDPETEDVVRHVEEANLDDLIPPVDLPAAEERNEQAS